MVLMLLLFVQATDAGESKCNSVQVSSKELPKELEKNIPKDMGVDSITKLSLVKGVELLAATATPNWFLNNCSGGTQVSHSRLLVVWKKTEAYWEEIGRSDKVLYSVDTAGVLESEVLVKDSSFIVRNSAHSPSRMMWMVNDDYWFTYDKDANRIRLVKQESSKLDYHKKFYGDFKGLVSKGLSDADGFIGKVYYMLGVGTFEKLKYGQSKGEAHSFSVKAPPFYLEDISGSRFTSLPYIKIGD